MLSFSLIFISPLYYFADLFSHKQEKIMITFALLYAGTRPIPFDCLGVEVGGSVSVLLSLSTCNVVFLKPVALQPPLNRPVDQSSCGATEVDVVMRRCLRKCESACLCI